MKKMPLRPPNAPKSVQSQPKKVKEVLPIADQILMLQARLVQMEIIMRNIENDKELYEKRRKVYQSVDKLVTLDGKVDEYLIRINEKLAFESNIKILNQMKRLMDLCFDGQDQSRNPLVQFSQDHQKYKDYLRKQALQVNLKDCEASQSVLLKTMEQAIMKCDALTKVLKVVHNVDEEELQNMKKKSVQDLDVIKSIDCQNQEIWTVASQELDLLYKHLSDLILKSKIN
jgi:hypothetical protein